jgi:hypothetical protein
MKVRLKNRFQKDKGQSTVEFIFVFIAFIFFLSLSYNAVVSFAVYQYLSYATFMTARAYQASRDDPAAQLEAAKKTMAIYVSNVQPGSGSTPFGFSRNKTLATITAFTTPTPNPGNFLTPFRLDFEVPLITVPLGQDLKRDFGTLKLSTQSSLGREPTKAECVNFFKSFIQKFLRGGGGPAGHSWEGMEDNGC